MKTQKFDINKQALNLTGLKSDLKSALEFSVQRFGSMVLALQEDWISAIDSENMNILMSVYNTCPSTFSINSLALHIIKKYK